MKKTILMLICSAILICPLAGCSVGASSSQDSAAVQSSEKNLTDFEPIAVPENGWTEETISAVTYINGEKHGFPLRLDDFGDGFSLQTSGGSFLKKGDKNTVGICYNGKNCGLITVKGDCDENTIGQKDIVSITFSLGSDLDPDAPDVFPISINGVTIGSTYDELVEKLGFVYEKKDIDPSNSDKIFYVTGTTAGHAYRFQFSHNIVCGITIAEHSELV